MALNPNVVVVNPGELITADHLNKIRSNLDRLDTTKVLRAGDTMTGNLVVGGDPNTPVAGMRLWTSGTVHTVVDAAGSANLSLRRIGTPAAAIGEKLAVFARLSTGGEIGSIAIASATTVAYNASCDERVKERTGDAATALDDAVELGRLVYRGRYVADEGEGREWLFVNSQDVNAVAPYAVMGADDAVDDDGNVIIQQLDRAALVPMLLAAVAQLADRVADLEAAAP